MPRNSAPSHLDLWEPSSSSEEDWGDEAWEVRGIAQDHVNTRGELRFNIEWEGWRRDDGSNMTWEMRDGTTMRDLTGLQRDWQKTRDKELEREADDPKVTPFSPSFYPEEQTDGGVNETRQDPRMIAQYTFTELVDQRWQKAIQFKDEDRFSMSSALVSADTRLQQLRDARDAALRALDTTISEAPSLSLYDLGRVPHIERRRRARNKAPLHHRMQSLRLHKPTSPVTEPEPETVAHALVSRSSTPRSDDEFPKAQINPQRPESRLSNHVETSNSKRKREVFLSSSRTFPLGIDYTQPSPTLNLREILQQKWTRAVEKARAAPLTFVDDFDMASAPVENIEKFKYLEFEYVFGPDVPLPDEEFIESCECSLGCTASLCSCQNDSHLEDDTGHSTAFAYDSQGLFAFRENMRTYVVECNKKCLCDATCRSRVAQLPRKFPIEIFRTDRRGWGVRSTVDLPKGSVLGVFTGEIISRAQSLQHDGKRGAYIFDLDFYSNHSAHNYSVDAFNCGNWTRFVNHSCDPVCIVYPVIWDSIPSMHQPRLAFVANTDIPARTELTVDYNPKLRKGKKKAKTNPGIPDCLCGAASCLGYIYDN